MHHFFAGDRLTLELMVTTFSDVRSWLKEPQEVSAADLSLLALLSDGEVQQSLQQDLLNAFYHYKASLG